MKIDHQQTIITLENQGERQKLLRALYIANEISQTALRTGQTTPVLIRAGFDPDDMRAVGQLVEFTDELIGGL